MLLCFLIIIPIWSLLVFLITKKLLRKHNDSVEILLDFLIKDTDSLKNDLTNEKKLDTIRENLRILKDELKGIL